MSTLLFLNQRVLFLNTEHIYEFNEKNSLYFLISKFIVGTIVGDTVFHPDDADGVTQKRALRIFAHRDDEGEDINRDLYTVAIRSLRRFRLAICFIALGNSFRSVRHHLNVIREESGTAAYGGASDVSVSNYSTEVMAMYL